MTNRMIPTSIVSRIDRAISPLAKSGQNPNQTPGQQTQNPNQGGQQSGGQQRDPQRLMETNCSLPRAALFSRVFRLPIRLFDTSHS
jgi:hypothetical protein